MGLPSPTRSCYTNNNVQAPNPDLEHYKIISIHHFYRAFILKVHYKNCTNYEGIKIILYKGKCNPFMLQAPLDPHFTEFYSKFPKPFARFEPTEEGLNAAITLAKQL